MSGIPVCLSTDQANSIWKSSSYSSHQTNAIIIAKLVLLYAFIKTVVGESGVINDLKTIVSDVELYKQQIGEYLSTTHNGDINAVAGHINSSFETCVRNIKKDAEAPPHDVHNLLVSALDTFHTAMLSPTTAQSPKFFSELTTLSAEFLRQPYAFNFKSTATATKLEQLDKSTLIVYLTTCTGKDVPFARIRSILCGSLFLAAAMEPLIVVKPSRRGFFWGGGKKSRRHRKRKRQRNRISRQNK